jgi:hypothetical protein
MHRILPVLTLAAAAVLLGGCETSQQKLLETEKGQVELRQMQSRAFDTTDREKMLRTIMAPLQDLSFVIDKADAVLGSVTATKLDQYSLRMTVTVRPKGTTQLLVRASAQFNERAVVEPPLYQQFFTSLSKGIFLEAQAVE